LSTNVKSNLLLLIQLKLLNNLDNLPIKVPQNLYVWINHCFWHYRQPMITTKIDRVGCFLTDILHDNLVVGIIPGSSIMGYHLLCLLYLILPQFPTLQRVFFLTISYW